MKYLIFILLMLLLGCDDHAIFPSYNTPRNIYALRYGQTMTIPPIGLKIGFKDVLDESRCPMEAVCIWEGRAEILLSLNKQYLDTVFIQPWIAGGHVNRDHSSQWSIDTIGVHIEFLSLDPYPRLGFIYRKSDYVALLEISRN